MQLAYQQTQSIPTPTTTNTHNSTINTHTSSSYVADYTLFVKNTLEMTEKQLASTRKKTIEANTTSNINSSTTTSTKRKKKYSPPTTSATTSITTTADNNNSNTALPTINSESPLTPHTHTQSLIGADLLSIPRIGTKAVAALLAYVGSPTGRRIAEELLVEVAVRPYATTGTTTTSTGIGEAVQPTKVDRNNNDNIEMINLIQSDNNNSDNDDNNDDDDEVTLNTTTDSNTTLDTASDINAFDTISTANSTNDDDTSSSTSISSTSTSTSSTKNKSRSSNINRSIVSKSYLPLLNEVLVFTGKFSSMTRSGAGAVSEKLGTR